MTNTMGFKTTFALLLAVLSLSTSASALEASCDDGAGSSLRLSANPDIDSQANVLVAISGPVTNYLFSPENRDFVAKRYGMNDQDYRLNAQGQFLMFATLANLPDAPSVVAIKGGRYDVQVSVRKDGAGLKLFVDSQSWYFGSCR